MPKHDRMRASNELWGLNEYSLNIRHKVCTVAYRAFIFRLNASSNAAVVVAAESEALQGRDLPQQFLFFFLCLFFLKIATRAVNFL